MALCGLFPTSVKCIEPFRQPSRLANKLRQRKLGYHGTFKQPHVVKAINDNKEPADDQEKDENKTKAELNLLLSLLVAYPGLKGTIATAVGYYILHVDPLGSLHWNPMDAALGVLIALPVTAMDAITTLPNWEPKQTTRTVKFKVPVDVAEQYTKAGTGTKPSSNGSSPTEASSNGATPAVGATTTTTAIADKEEKDEEPKLVEVERQIPVRQDQHPFRTAMYRNQLDRVLGNPGRNLSIPSELILIAAVHTAEEMLYRGVILTAAARWCTDFLYATTFDDTLPLIGGLELSIPQAGALIAGLGFTFISVLLAIQSELVGPKIQAIASATQQAASKDPADSKMQRIREALELAKQTIEREQKWNIALTSTVQFVECSTLCASYLVTGNILAPIVGSIVADFVFTAFQRTKFDQIQNSRKKETDALKLRLLHIKQTNELQRQKRTASLYPPSASSIKATEEAAAAAAAADGSAVAKESQVGPEEAAKDSSETLNEDGNHDNNNEN